MKMINLKEFPCLKLHWYTICHCHCS